MTTSWPAASGNGCRVRRGRLRVRRSAGGGSHKRGHDPAPAARADATCRGPGPGQGAPGLASHAVVRAARRADGRTRVRVLTLRLLQARGGGHTIAASARPPSRNPDPVPPRRLRDAGRADGDRDDRRRGPADRLRPRLRQLAQVRRYAAAAAQLARSDRVRQPGGLGDRGDHHDRGRGPGLHAAPVPEGSGDSGRAAARSGCWPRRYSGASPCSSTSPRGS